MWQELARCLNADTELFYPPRSKGVYHNYADQARAYCFGRTEDEGMCPVIVECLLFALKNEEVHGIWGGLSSRERSGLRTRYAVPTWIEDEETTGRILNVIRHVVQSSSESAEREEDEVTVPPED